MCVYFIVYESFEVLGVYVIWVINQGYDVIYLCVYVGDWLFVDVEGMDFFIVMGGL